MGGFPGTRSTVIDGLKSEDLEVRQLAWDLLASLYWKPIYTYVRLKWNRSEEDARDLTQSFLTRAFEKSSLEGFDPEKARFRTWLRLQLDRYLANDWKAENREKRGKAVTFSWGEAENEIRGIDASELAPDDLLYKRWISSVFELALERLEKKSSHSLDCQLFREYDVDATVGSYREAAERYGVPETTITNRLAIARRRFRESVLDVLRESTVSDREFQSEVRSLLGLGIEQ